MRIAMLGAMASEIDAFREYKNLECHVVGISKPLASANTARVLAETKPDLCIFAGVAGALDESLELGDIGIVTGAIDADLDVTAFYTGTGPNSPKYLRGQMPFSTQRVYRSRKELCDIALDTPGVKTFKAYVATGSAFLNTPGKKHFIDNINPLLENTGELPNVYDMETFAVLLNCNLSHTPALVIRAISDTVHGDAPKDFNKFVENAVDCYVSVVDYVISKLELD